MAWKIELTENAGRTLRRLDRPDAMQIRTYLRDLAAQEDPHSKGKALSGTLRGYWRYRVGDYRIICDIQNDTVTVLVFRIGHRREVYEER